jgi:ABC-type transport system involved in multi-copper enzyme maturation permease subunit
MSAVGLFSSVVCSSSNISLLTSVSLWLVFLIVVPNVANMMSMAIVPVENINSMNTRMEAKRVDLEASITDPKKWESRRGNPFYPPHEVRAKVRMLLDQNDGEFWDAHYAAQFRQVETTRLCTWISPLSVFEYGMEALLDGGYIRLTRNYGELQNFKIQYLQWFKDIDAKDDKSPHWYNPAEDYSMTRKSVAYEDVPQFVESRATVAARLAETLKYLMILLAYMGVMFVVAVFRFEKYDVR